MHSLGTMQLETLLVEILQISSSPVEARTTTLTGGGHAQGSSSMPASDFVANMMANILPQATAGGGRCNASQGVYVGEGLPPVPMKMAAKIQQE